MSPFDDDKKSTQEVLDHTPLKFGKFRGKTPEQVAEIDPRYLCWAYETVSNFPTCSDALYRECGGRGHKAVAETAEQKYERQQREQEKEVRNARKSYGFDDDIPF